MNESRGNLALIEGPAIIVHGVNGGWLHGPKFGAGFAKSLAERGPLAREYRAACKAWPATFSVWSLS